MHEQDKAILKSLVAVAWADGRMASEETEMIDAFLSAYRVAAKDADDIREYARTPRTLADIPLSQLSSADRRLLLNHAVLLTFADGTQSDDEKKFLADLSETLRIPEPEAKEILDHGTARAQRLMALL